MAGGGRVISSSKISGNILPLAFVGEGEECEVVGLQGGRGMVQRLCDMGFTPGTVIRVLASNPPGPMLLDVRNTRIALGRGVAMKIMVSFKK